MLLMIKMNLSKIILLPSVLCTLNVFSQSKMIKVGEKVRIHGSHLVLFEFNDSVVCENNRFLYCFRIERDSFADVIDSNFVKKNESNQLKSTNYSFESFINYERYDYLGLHYGYIFKYAEFGLWQNNLDTSFRLDMKMAFENAIKETIDFFAPPYFYSYDSNKYGLYFKVVSLYVEGYLVYYKNFEDYEFDFLHGSHDSRIRKLVSTGMFSSKLFRLKQKKSEGYVVLIPTKVIKNPK